MLAALLALVAIGVLVAGIRSRMKDEAALKVVTAQMAVPSVSVVLPKQSAPAQELILPGNIQPFISSPVYARTDGYLKKWYFDIGAHVKAGDLLAVIETPEVDEQLAQARSTLKKVGTNNSVETVAKRRPPITARPRGAFCSPPSPSPKAIGNMPMIIANAVIKTGRKRIKPASSAAEIESLPCSICSVAKLTTRMLFAVATPIHMIVPISAGTLNLVCVMKRNHAIPAKAAGKAEIMMKGSSQDWKFTTIRR